MEKKNTASRNYSTNLSSILKENYQSVILGFIVFVVGLSLVVRLIGNKNNTESVKSEKTENYESSESTGTQITSDKYTVKKGDILWRIAEKKYGSGFNYVDIAKANKLTNPDILVEGRVLTLPSVTSKKPTKGQVGVGKSAKITVTGNKYTVKKGDHLWKIAVNAYGDGYKWSKIASSNKLKNPNKLMVGTVLSLPR